MQRSGPGFALRLNPGSVLRIGSFQILAAALALWSTPSRAGALNLEFEGDPLCTSRDAIEGRVDQLLGGPSNTEPLRAKVATEARSGGVLLRLEMWVNGEAFSRELEVSSCEEAEKAASLILALAIRPDLGVETPRASASEPQASDPAPAPESPAARAEPVRAPQPVEKPPFERRHLTGSLGLGYGASAFVLPRVGHGVEVALGLGYGSFRADLYGLFQLPVRISLPEDSGRGGTFSLAVAGLRGCGTLRLGELFDTLELDGGVCAQGEAGRLGASGFGSVSTEDVDRAWGALGGGVELGIGLGGPSMVRLGVSALAPLVHDSFDWEGAASATVPIASVSDVFARFEVSLVIPL